MSSFVLFGVPGQVAKILQYLEANGVQIDNLELVDATVSSRAPASTALSSAVWTSAKAAMIDRSISSTSPLILKSQKFTASGTWNVPTGIMGRMVYLTGVGGGASGNVDSGGPVGGGAGMACQALPLTLDAAVSSVSVTVGAGGAASTGTSQNKGGDTKFGDFLVLRGATNSPLGKGAKHLGLTAEPDGFRHGFMISGADAEHDCVDTGYMSGGSHGGGASAFANGGSTGSLDGSAGSGGAGALSGTSGAGGDGFLEVFWFEQL